MGLKPALFALICAAAGGAQAQTGGWYAAGAVTGSFLKDPDSHIENAPTPGAQLFITNGVKSGWGGQLEVGHAFGAFRVEGEIGKTKNTANTYSVTSPLTATIPQTGSDRITRYMVNGYFDAPVGSLPFHPYIGAGLGRAEVHVATTASRPFGPPTAPTKLIDESVHGLAWQLMAGAALPVTPNLSLTAQYRWLDAGTLDGRDTRGEPFHTKISGHNLDLGVRFLF